MSAAGELVLKKLWDAYQLGQVSADHAAREVFYEVLSPVLSRLGALVAQNEALIHALEECANRFERCCIHSGSDKEFAAHAVEDYRDLVEVVRAGKEKS